MQKVLLNQNPIFIVGFPRSGTTLLQSLLSQQKNLYSFQETHFFCNVINKINYNGNKSIKLESLEKTFKIISIKTGHNFNDISQNNISLLAHKKELTIKILFEFLVFDLLKKQNKNNEISKMRWIEKTPGHLFQMEMIHSLYDNAKFIEIIRDPLNSIASVKKKLVPDESYFYLAKRWRYGRKVFRDFSKRFPNNTISIKYEELIKNPGKEIIRVCNFLGINYNHKDLSVPNPSSKFHIRDDESWKSDNLKFGVKNNNMTYKWSFSYFLLVLYLVRKEILIAGYIDKFFSMHTLKLITHRVKFLTNL